MAFSKIEESVLAAARSEGQSILQSAEHATRERVEREIDALRRSEAQRFQHAARALDDAAARVVSRARGECSKQELQRRNTVLDAVFNEAKRQFLAMSPTAYATEMRKWLERAAGTGGGALRIHPDDRNTFESMLAQFNAGRNADARVSIETSTPLTVRGGFILVADTFEVDQMLETIMNDLKYGLGPELAAELFAG